LFFFFLWRVPPFWFILRFLRPVSLSLGWMLVCSSKSIFVLVEEGFIDDQHIFGVSLGFDFGPVS
jgi:hypothetical protein